MVKDLVCFVIMPSEGGPKQRDPQRAPQNQKERTAWTHSPKLKCSCVIGMYAGAEFLARGLEAGCTHPRNRNDLWYWLLDCWVRTLGSSNLQSHPVRHPKESPSFRRRPEPMRLTACAPSQLDRKWRHCFLIFNSELVETLVGFGLRRNDERTASVVLQRR